MNKVMSAIQNRDAGALVSMMPKEPQRRVVNDQAEKLVDALFANLMQIFPAARQTVLSTPEDIAAAKRQWILAFAENGITSLEQVKAGMRMARQQATDFWPSCGKFIGWCKEGSAAAAGLPTIDEVMAEFERYSANRDRYESPEVFPWSAPVMYWLVLDVRKAMYRYNHTEAETRKTVKNQLNLWAKKLAVGESIPMPVVQIAHKTRIPAVCELMDETGEYRRRGAEILSQIREKAREK